MADDVTLPGTGVVVAADDVASVFYQKVKIDLGGDGAASPLVRGQQAMANSLPVAIASDQGSLTVDGSGVTQPVSAASLPLPTGASTAAKQPALGTAGSASADVITVQGVASMTPLLVNGSGATQPVSGTVTANLAAGTNNIGDVDVLSIAAGDNNIGNVDIVTVPADPFGANADAAATAGSTGSIQAKLRLMTSQLDLIKTAVETLDNTVGGSELQVDVVGALPAGTNAIGKLAANSGVDIGDVDVTSVNGQSAHDAAVAGSPIRIAGRAETTEVTAVADGDTCDIMTDINGRQVVAPYAVPERIISGSGTAITGTSAQEQLAAGGAGIRNYVTSIMVTNSHATVGTLVEIRDGTTTVLWRGYAAPAGGGWAITFPVPLRGTANTAVNAYNITTGSNTYVNVAGYRAP